MPGLLFYNIWSDQLYLLSSVDTKVIRDKIIRFCNKCVKQQPLAKIFICASQCPPHGRVEQKYDQAPKLPFVFLIIQIKY